MATALVLLTDWQQFSVHRKGTVGSTLTLAGIDMYYDYMGKAHKNCIIGKILCLRHIIGTTFITRMTLYVYIVEGFKTSQNIYTFI